MEKDEETPEQKVLRLVHTCLDVPAEEAAVIAMDVLSVIPQISAACEAQLGVSPWRPLALLVALKYQELQVDAVFRGHNMDRAREAAAVIAHGLFAIGKAMGKPEADA